MPLPFGLEKEDFTSFRYNRKVHLILLLKMIVLSVVISILSYIANDQTSPLFCLILFLLYLLFWWLRAHEKCAGLFPAFHYITLMIEYVLHCLSAVSFIILLLGSLLFLAASLEPLAIILVVFILFYVVFYGFIVFKMTPFVITLFRGSPAEKEEMGREICGQGSGVPPGGPAGAGMAQPLPVQVQTN